MDEHDFIDSNDSNLNSERCKLPKQVEETLTASMVKHTGHANTDECTFGQPSSSVDNSSQENICKIRGKTESSDSGIGESTFIDPSWFDEDSSDVFPNIKCAATHS